MTATDVVIVGAGPSGLSCAIEAKKAGLSVIILEQGSLVDAIRRFPQNLIWFSTPELLQIGDVPFVIPSVRPTRIDTLNYYQHVADHHKLDVRYFDGVQTVVRNGDSLEVKTEGGKVYPARTVILATGYFDHPNRLGVPGEEQPNVLHYYDEAYRYFDCDIAVIGGRNSAVEAALDLYRHGARVTLIHRGEKLSEGVKYWILPDIENRIKAGQVTALFQTTVQEFRPGAVIVQGPNGKRELRADFSFVLIGFRPDTSMLTRCGVEIDPETLSPRINPDTFETNVPGLFVAGSLVAGKNNNKIFVENGRLHAKSIVPAIASKLGKSVDSAVRSS